MPAAPRPDNDAERLAELDSYKILDTAPDDGFDDLIYIASKIFHVPVSLVSLVSEERQWFKACVGLDASETPRELAFCAYTMQRDKPFVVENALEHPLVSDNDLVTGDPKIRFYAGAPLINSNGFALGSLCVIDFEPRSVSEEQLDLLSVLANQVVCQMERHKSMLELRETVLELEEARKVAIDASHAKSSFLASMSHELRTPMNSIIGFTSRLQKSIGDSLRERDRDALETVDRNAKYLLTLINDILDLSKIEAGRVNLQRSEFDVCQVVEGVVAAVAPMAEEKRLLLAVEAPIKRVPLIADRTRVTQILNNLISNAVRYTDEGGITVRIGTEPTCEGADWLVLSVSDTGIGIRAEDKPKLFHKFTQLHQDERHRKGGTGLGLVITKEFVKMHDGEIGIESTYGEGTTVTVRLPLSGSDDRQVRGASPDPVVGDSEQGIHVLCVDDDPDVLKLLKLTFEDEGYRVALSQSHDEALKTLEDCHPDVICLDVCMPGKSGYDVLDSLAKDTELSEIPVVLISAVSDLEKPWGKRARCFLPKPIDVDELLNEVRAVMAQGIESVLVVEDCSDTANLLTGLLEDCNVKVHHAENGRAALEQLEKRVPSAILLDLMMPEMDGVAFLREFEKHPEYEDTPVFILTAKELGDDEVEYLETLSEAIITKGKDSTTKLIDCVLRRVRARNKEQEAIPFDR